MSVLGRRRLYVVHGRGRSLRNNRGCIAGGGTLGNGRRRRIRFLEFRALLIIVALSKRNTLAPARWNKTTP